MAAGGNKKLGQKIKDRRLARSIWADQGVNLAPSHLQVDVAYRDEALELLGQAFGFEYVIVHCQQRGTVTGCPLLQFSQIPPAKPGA